MAGLEEQFQKQEEKRVESERLRRYGPAKTSVKRQFEEGKLTLETLQRLESQVLEKTLKETVQQLDVHYMEMVDQLRKFSSETVQVQVSIEEMKVQREQSDQSLARSLTNLLGRLDSLIHLFTKYVADNQRAVDNINRYLADWT